MKLKYNWVSPDSCYYCLPVFPWSDICPSESLLFLFRVWLWFVQGNGHHASVQPTTREGHDCAGGGILLLSPNYSHLVSPATCWSTEKPHDCSSLYLIQSTEEKTGRWADSTSWIWHVEAWCNKQEWWLSLSISSLSKFLDRDLATDKMADLNYGRHVLQSRFGSFFWFSLNAPVSYSLSLNWETEETGRLSEQITLFWSFLKQQTVLTYCNSECL